MSGDKYIGRFAPSPSGRLHFGSMVAAIGSWLEARKSHGKWLLRIDDLDPPRVAPGAIDNILRTLEAFGLTWDDAVIYQSQRNESYENALTTLKSQGAVFPCFCSRKDLDGARIYPGTCRERNDEEGRTWRFKSGQGLVEWDDQFTGMNALNRATDIGDFLVRGVENVFSYHLANVVDDADFNITHVIRGSDLTASSGCHILLQRALGFPSIEYGHLPLARDEMGIKLSKQTHAKPVEVGEASDCIHAVLTHLGIPDVERDIPANMLQAALRGTML